MKTLLPLVVALIFLFSCKKDSPSSDVSACGVNDPVRNLPWLREMIEDAKQKKTDNILTITLVEIKGEPIFNYYLSYMSCIGCVSYRCDGSLVDRSKFTQAELEEFQKNIWDANGKRIVIWPKE